MILSPAVHAGSKKSRAKPWATVNLCDPASRPGAMGVRVGMPAGPGSQWMRVQAEWYNAKARRWMRSTIGDSGWRRLGNGRRGLRGGATFTFAVPSPGRVLLLRGVVRLQWRSGKKVVRSRKLRTRGGHARSAGGRSWAQCVVPG